MISKGKTAERLSYKEQVREATLRIDNWLAQSTWINAVDLGSLPMI